MISIWKQSAFYFNIHQQMCVCVFFMCFCFRLFWVENAPNNNTTLGHIYKNNIDIMK